MMNETITTILNRKSVREFADKQVDSAFVEVILRSAMSAPSARNRQPWKFKIVTDDEKNRIAAALMDKTKEIEGHTGVHTAGVINDASKLVVVFIDNQISENREMDILSIGAAIENMLLSLTDMGIGSVWIGNTNIVNKEIRNILNIEYETVSSIAIGVPDQSPKPRPRKDIKDVVL
jgi:nitroreductase